MTDENQNSVIEEVAPPVQEANEVKETQPSQEQVSNQHLKAMRLKNAELEKRLREREEMLDKLVNKSLDSQPVPQKEVDEFDAIGSDEFIPKGKVEKLVEKKAQQYAEQIVKREVEGHIKRHTDAQFMDRLNRQYADFSEVVNPETLSLLEEKEPELAQTIADLKDPYKIGLQSYKMIKAMGIAESAPANRRTKEIEKAIEKSDKAIPSPMAHDKRPIAQAFKLTDAMKKDLYREMHGYAQQANSVPEMT